MNLEVINKTHTEINRIKRTDKAVCLMTVEKKSFYFTAEAVKVFGMAGKYLHFIRGKNEHDQPNGTWYMNVNDINTGFKITATAKSGARVNSMPMVRLFTQATKHKVGATFYLQNTPHTLQGGQLVEILLHKSVQQLKK